MKYEVFKGLIETTQSIYDDACEHDRKLQEVFGGDSSIQTDWWDKHLEMILKNLELEFGDKTEMVDWLFWECMNSVGGNLTFIYEDIEYEGTVRNVYLFLTNNLNEGTAE